MAAAITYAAAAFHSHCDYTALRPDLKILINDMRAFYLRAASIQLLPLCSSTDQQLLTSLCKAIGSVQFTYQKDQCSLDCQMSCDPSVLFSSTLGNMPDYILISFSLVINPDLLSDTVLHS